MRAFRVVASGLLPLLLSSYRPPQDATRAAWREDLRFLYRELERIHPRLFHAHPRAEWEGAVQALEAELPRLDEAGFVVGLLRIVKLAEDGHTTLVPIGSDAMARCWPIATRHWRRSWRAIPRPRRAAPRA